MNWMSTNVKSVICQLIEVWFIFIDSFTSFIRNLKRIEFHD